MYFFHSNFLFPFTFNNSFPYNSSDPISPCFLHPLASSLPPHLLPSFLPSPQHNPSNSPNRKQTHPVANCSTPCYSTPALRPLYCSLIMLSFEVFVHCYFPTVYGSLFFGDKVIFLLHFFTYDQAPRHRGFILEESTVLITDDCSIKYHPFTLLCKYFPPNFFCFFPSQYLKVNNYKVA